MQQFETRVEAARNNVEQIKRALRTGALSYEDAREEAELPLHILNQKAREIAREHSAKFRPLSFAVLMR